MIEQLVPQTCLYGQMAEREPDILHQLGSYVLTHRLAISGQAMLYLSLRNGQPVVLKVYESSPRNDIIYQNQKKLLKQAEAPGIISVEETIEGLELMSNEGQVYRKFNVLVLPYFKNGDLMEWVQVKKPFTEISGKYFAQKIISRLRLLHCKNILHRDIKPENILLDNNYQPVIIDFGLATDYKHHNHGFVGTACIAAPEIIKGKQYTQKSEIYSLGIILFFLLTGHYPYRIAKVTEAGYRLLLQHKYSKFWQCFEQRFGLILSDSFKKLFVSMVDHDPSRRPSLQNLLEYQWMQGEVTSQEQFVRSMRMAA